MKVLVPRSLAHTLTLASDDELVAYDPTSPVPEDSIDAEVLVAWGNSADQLADSAARLANLRLVQSLSAGSDAVLAAGFPDSVVIASGRTLHDATVAEHTLALILAAVRGLNTLTRLQDQHVWSFELGGEQSESKTDPLITLFGAEVTIWGFGSIGRTLAPLLRDLGARVVGVAHTLGERDGFPVIGVDEVDERLRVTDVLVGILPGTPENRKIIDARVIGLLPARAWLVNVGRGSTVDEDALVRALRSRAIAGAALDVFELEPLPTSSPLWGEPNAILTPHAAGGRPRGAADLIERNLRALRTGQGLHNIVRAPLLTLEITTEREKKE